VRAHTDRTTPAGQPAHHQQHPPGQAQQPPRLIAQATVAHLPSKTIDHGAGQLISPGLPDSPQRPSFIGHPPTRPTRLSRPAIMTASPPALPQRPRPDRRTDPRICPGRFIWITYSAPTVAHPCKDERLDRRSGAHGWVLLLRIPDCGDVLGESDNASRQPV
jgi:hypothetical protein